MKQITHDIFLVIGILMLAVILFGAPLMVLWNWLMPTIFGLPEIGFWQACGLQLLATILFKSTSLKTNKD
jgi:hypothetical protein